MPSLLEELQRPKPRPGTLTLSAAAWLLSCCAGLAVTVQFVVRYDEVREGLTATILADDPGRAPGSLDSAVDTTLLLTFAAFAVPIVLKAILAMLMTGQRNWARFALALVGVLALPLGGVSTALLTFDTVPVPAWVPVAVGAQEVLVLVGLVTMFLPPSNAWFRSPRPARRSATGR